MPEITTLETAQVPWLIDRTKTEPFLWSMLNVEMQRIERGIMEGIPLPRPEGHAPAPVAEARINHGRWIVDCLWCNSAQFALPACPFFYCADCFNEQVGHKVVPVAFPEHQEVLEKLLLIRPIENRNWYVGETVEHIERENKEHY